MDTFNTKIIYIYNKVIDASRVKKAYCSGVLFEFGATSIAMHIYNECSMQKKQVHIYHKIYFSVMI